MTTTDTPTEDQMKTTKDILTKDKKAGQRGELARVKAAAKKGVIRDTKAERRASAIKRTKKRAATKVSRRSQQSQSKSEKLVVVLSLADTQLIVNKAEDQGLDVSDFVRLKCISEDPTDEVIEQELRDLTASLKVLTDDASVALSDGLEVLNKTLESLRSREQG